MTPALTRRLTTRLTPNWWRGKDSNLRRRKPADLQSAPVGRLGTPPGKNEPRILVATPPGVNGIGATFAMEFRGPAAALRGFPGASCLYRGVARQGPAGIPEPGARTPDLGHLTAV